MRRAAFVNAWRTERHPFAAALGFVLLVAIFIGGVHAGAMAGTGNGALVVALCSHDNNDRDGQQPADPRADLCCVAGCLAHAPALVTPPVIVPEPGLTNTVSIGRTPAAVSVAGEERRFNKPRGPPSLA